MDLKKLGTNFQAVYIDPPLLLPGENPSPGKITVEQLVCIIKKHPKIKIDNIMINIIFGRANLM